MSKLVCYTTKCSHKRSAASALDCTTDSVVVSYNGRYSEVLPYSVNLSGIHCLTGSLYTIHLYTLYARNKPCHKNQRKSCVEWIHSQSDVHYVLACGEGLIGGSMMRIRQESKASSNGSLKIPMTSALMACWCVNWAPAIYPSARVCGKSFWQTSARLPLKRHWQIQIQRNATMSTSQGARVLKKCSTVNHHWLLSCIHLLAPCIASGSVDVGSAVNTFPNGTPIAGVEQLVIRCVLLRSRPYRPRWMICGNHRRLVSW